MSINHNRRSALLLLGCDLLSVVVIFNLVTYARGVSLGFLVWPLLAPAVILVVSLHLIDGYGSNSDMMSLDYASLHLIAAFSALLVTVFLTPPSLKILEERLRKRGADAEAVVRKRLAVARQEVAQWKNFDYLIISGSKQDDLRQTLAIVEAEKMRTTRTQPGQF